jgi:hypothetical protein
MKTNISIEIDDDQRLNLGQKYHETKSKKKISRKELNEIVKYFVLQLLKNPTTTRKTIENIVSTTKGMKYFFNGIQVSEETYNDGIEQWLTDKS